MAGDEERRRLESEVHLQMAWQGCWRAALHCVIVESCRLIGVPAIIWPCSLKMALLPFKPFSSQSVWQKTAGSRSPLFHSGPSLGCSAHTCDCTHAHTRAYRQARKYCVAHAGAGELNQKRCSRALNARCRANLQLLERTKRDFQYCCVFYVRCMNICEHTHVCVCVLCVKQCRCRCKVTANE